LLCYFCVANGECSGTETMPQIQDSQTLGWWIRGDHSCSCGRSVRRPSYFQWFLFQCLLLMFDSSFIFSHPGDAADPVEYVIHLPEASAPVVTFLGVVVEQGGKLNEGLNLLHYILRVTVYDTQPNTVSFQIARISRMGDDGSTSYPILHTAVFITGTYLEWQKITHPFSGLNRRRHFMPVRPDGFGKSWIRGRSGKKKEWTCNEDNLITQDLYQ